MLLSLALSSVLISAQPSLAQLQVKEDATFNAICSAVVIEQAVHPLLVTEEHCLEEGKSYYADTVPLVEVYRKDGYVAFRAQGRASRWRPIRMSSLVPRAGERVYSAGYPYTEFYSATAGTVAGYSTHDGVDYIWMDLEVIGGMSGGAILDRRGHLLTLVRMVRTDGFGSPNGLAASGSPTSFAEFVAAARRKS